MLTFKEFCNERVIAAANGLIFHNKDGNHFDDRFKQRVHDDFSFDDLKTMLRDASVQIKTLGKGSSVLIYSKSFNRGIVLTSNKDKNWNLVTILPKGKDFAKPNTAKILVESYNALGEDVYVYLTDILETTEHDLDLINIEDISMVYIDGQIWDCTATIININ